jgi:oligopeptide/dipeptide ABC transporter ATP-binding protein
MENQTDEFLLDIQGLKTHFYTEEGVGLAVDGVDLQLRRGETLGLAGESGCGKTMTALSVLRLVPSPPGRIVGGKILFEGQDLLELNEEEMRQVRGREISMIFQEPMTSLNPVLTIGEQIAEVIRLHQKMDRKRALVQATEMLDLVRVPEARIRIREYPHQLSGGMRQRVMIAMALSCHPKLMVADEPTTALDVTTQAQILDLLDRLKKETGVSIILITHNLGVIAEMTQTIAIMYAGRVVEWINGGEIFLRAKHPYTVGLLACFPNIEEEKQLEGIPGNVPNIYRLPLGCKFSERCKHVFHRCQEEPPLKAVEVGHKIRCWLYTNGND